MSLSARRAWIEMLTVVVTRLVVESLSARRAWIEIRRGSRICHRTAVALRKESVDRNGFIHYNAQGIFWSLSARRAWIEMHVLVFTNFSPAVALRKESVDRNVSTATTPTSSASRSPQGERG